MQKTLIALVLIVASFSTTQAFEVGKTYVGVDSEGKNCRLEIQHRIFLAHIGGSSHFLSSNSKSKCSSTKGECSLYSDTEEQTLVRNLSWDKSGNVEQLVINSNNGSYTFEEGPKSDSQMIARLKFHVNRQSQTCYNLVTR